MMDFNTIYDTYAQQVFRICKGYTKDLVQEIFISVWRNLASFRNQSKISTWIFRIATNHCLRAMEVSRRMTIEQLPAQLVEPSSGESMEEKLALLYRCIKELPEIDRIIIALVLEDVPQGEIALIVGFSDSNTRARIHRIKEKLAVKCKLYGQSE
jgi:RNA polymerase sigma-70 factor, ECF subfamily